MRLPRSHPQKHTLTASIPAAFLLPFFLLTLPALAQSTLLPTSASGGTGTVADIEANDKTSYVIARGGVASIGGFGTTGETISSVYLMLEYGVEAGYDGTGAIQVNGINTSIVPANGEGARAVFIDITGGSFGIDTSNEISNLTVGFTNSDTGAGNSVRLDYVHVLVNPSLPIQLPPTFAEEFDGINGSPADPDIWSYEQGYMRNNEDQYYQVGATNGWQENGEFIIEARVNDNGHPYTSASIRSVGNYSWQYGRAQIRAKIPAVNGLWPAIWTVGDVGEWPSNGECDIMEYYQETIKANCAVAHPDGTRWKAKWDSSTRTLGSLLTVDPNWRNEYHVWTMQWDESNVRLYVDNILMNTIPQSWLNNSGQARGGAPEEPFKQPHNLWLNLALGGDAGGNPPAANTFPHRYHIDYWRVWEGVTDNSAPTDIALSNANVAEGLPAGTVIGNLSATDADPAEVIRYQIVPGVGDAALFEIPEFVSDSTTAGILRTAAVLDYTEATTRTVRIRAIDIEGATYEEDFTITVQPDSRILVSTPTLSVNEGGTNSFDVRLSHLPASNVTVNVAHSAGDTDLSVTAGSTLTFTPTNGMDWQTVTIGAANDADATFGTATITCSDAGAVFSAVSVEATEIDDDNQPPSVSAGSPQTIYLQGGGASPAAGADIYLDAGLDDGANSTWEDSLGLWDLSIDAGVTWVADAGSSLAGITSAYEFPGGTNITANGCDGGSLQNMVPRRDLEPITLEIWFKPDASASYPPEGQILWETGGDTGFGIFYRDGVVETCHDVNGDILSANVSTLTDEFIQIVVTYDTNLDPDPSVNNFKLYINGGLRDSARRSDNDLCGGDGAALGNKNGTKVGGRGSTNDVATFDGKIAIFRSYHNQVLNEAEVISNYNSIAGASASVTLGGTASDPEGDPFTLSWTKSGGSAGDVGFSDNSIATPDAYFYETGVYTLRLTADDGTTQPSSEVTITVSSATAYPTWTQGTFANVFSDTGTNSNPDGDRSSNLMEFAFGTDPTLVDDGPLSYNAGGDVTSYGNPILKNFSTPESPDYRAVFLRRKDHVAAGLTYSVEFSAELSQWTVDGTTPTVLTGAESSGDYEAVSVPLPATVPAYESSQNLPPQFFRVGIQAN